VFGEAPQSVCIATAVFAVGADMTSTVVMVLVSHNKRIWCGIFINFHLSSTNFQINLVPLAGFEISKKPILVSTSDTRL
jgi:hypothetical protein